MPLPLWATLVGISVAKKLIVLIVASYMGSHVCTGAWSWRGVSFAFLTNSQELRTVVNYRMRAAQEMSKRSQVI